MKHAAIVLALLFCAPLAHAQFDVTQPSQTFEERSPHSPLKEQVKRLNWSDEVVADPKNTYTIRGETFRVFLPKRYKAKRTYGLLVWVSPGTKGVFPPAWEKYLSRRKLICVGASNSGNERPTPVRIGLALDAVHNVTRLHKIDPKRIYVTGFSGGGNMATVLTFHYPDVFRGGIYINGTTYYRHVPVPGSTKMWGAGMPEPGEAFLKLGKERTRHVWMSGAKDEPAVAQAKGVIACAEEDGFKQITYVHVPGMGHDVPTGKQMDRCLKIVDTKPKKAKGVKKEEKEEPSRQN